MIAAWQHCFSCYMAVKCMYMLWGNSKAQQDLTQDELPKLAAMFNRFVVIWTTTDAPLYCALRLGLLYTHAAVVLQAVVRAVCAIIDAFHFDVSTQSPAQAEDAADQDKKAQELQAEDDAVEAAASCQAEAESAHKEIQSALTRRVLPSLRAQLVHDGQVSTATWPQ